MQVIGQFFNTVFFNPILNLLIGFYTLFSYLKVPGAFGFSIISLTLFIRLILHPFFKQQMDTARKMQEMKPHLDKLQAKHKNEPKKLQEEQMKLYSQAGINPASGCLFMLIQMPVFIALYQTLSMFLGTKFHPKLVLPAGGEFDAINKVLYFPFLKLHSINPWFFGIDLMTTPQKAGNIFYFIIPVVTAALQYLQVQASTPSLAPAAPDKQMIKKDDDKKKEDSGDFQKAMNTQMKYIFPLMIGWFSMSMPVGLSLYWNIFSLFSIMQARQTKK